LALLAKYELLTLCVSIFIFDQFPDHYFKILILLENNELHGISQ